MNRSAALLFDEQNRAAIGNTKLRLFQSLGVSGDPKYNFADPAGARAAWDTASAVGTWLSLLRIADAWLMPGQPQYSPQFQGIEPAKPDMTLDELLEQASKEGVEAQAQITSILRASAEYRQAREIFGDAEADMYMVERYGVLPSFLQSASTGIVERPVTWGGVEHLNQNEWLYDAAPLTLAGTVPADADPTFNSEAWNNLFGEYLELEGLENQPIRKPRSPSELAQAINRGMGYDQVRFLNAVYDRQVEALRAGYGDGYSSMPGYRAKKKELDRLLAENTATIYTQFPIVRGSNQGAIVGSAQGVTTRMLVDEDGDLYSVTAAQTFDEHDDAALIDAYDTVRSIDPVKGEWTDFARSNEQKLIDLGILGGRIEDGGMTNVTQLTRLLTGAARQQSRKQSDLEAALCEILPQLPEKLNQMRSLPNG